MTLVILCLLPFAIPRGHSSLTGKVCIASLDVTQCPSTSQVFTGNVGSIIHVGVFLDSSDGLNGFFVSLIADHFILQPLNASLAGTILPEPRTVVIDCVQGIIRFGSTCPSTDTYDTITLAAACLGCSIPAPASGLLFTATYKVVGTTAGQVIGFQTGCGSSSSIVGTGTCILVSNGSVVDSETAQTGVFISSEPFAIQPVNRILTGLTNTYTISKINVTALGGYTGTVRLSFIVTPGGENCRLLQDLFVFNSTFTAATVTLSCRTSFPNSYTINVTATDSVTTVQTQIFLIIQGFQFTGQSTSIAIQRGQSAIAYAGLVGLNLFEGPVIVTAVLTPTGPHNPSLSPQSQTVWVSSFYVNVFSVTISTTLITSLRTYLLTLTASYGGISMFITIPVSVTPEPNICRDDESGQNMSEC